MISKLTKKRVAKSIDVEKKLASTEIRTPYLTPDLLLESQLHSQLGQFWWPADDLL